MNFHITFGTDILTSSELGKHMWSSQWQFKVSTLLARGTELKRTGLGRKILQQPVPELRVLTASWLSRSTGLVLIKLDYVVLKKGIASKATLTNLYQFF